MTKMTKKTAFQIAQEALNTIETEEARNAWEIIQKEIDRLERAALKAKITETKADREKAEFRQNVMEVVADLMTEGVAGVRANEVANAMAVSTQKASAALNALVAEGSLRKVDGEKRTILFATIEG